MPRFLNIALALAGLAIAARAEFPLGSMKPSNLGIQYGLTFRGQNITSQDIPSHETIHAFSLGYAPIPYLGLEAGLGLDRFKVDRYSATRFRGEYGISPLFGLTLASPYILETIRFAAGSRFLYLNSEDGNGYAYKGWISSPWLSLIASPSPYFDLQAGARGHRVDGIMESPGGSARNFMNRETFRGFFTFTIKSPGELAFLSLDVDMSPKTNSEWSNGPREASVGISFGTLLGRKTKSPQPKTPSTFFPGYSEMKERQNKMAEDLE